MDGSFLLRRVLIHILLRLYRLLSSCVFQPSWPDAGSFKKFLVSKQKQKFELVLLLFQRSFSVLSAFPLHLYFSFVPIFIRFAFQFVIHLGSHTKSIAPVTFKPMELKSEPKMDDKLERN
jgi:hypothetical protein